MTDLFVRTHLFLARHRGWVLVLAGLFAVGALLLSRRLKLNEDYTDMLPMSDPAIAEQVAALKHIRQADRLFLDVQTAAVDSEVLAQAADRMHEALQAIPGLIDIRYSFAGTDAGDLYEQLQEQLPTLLNSNDLREVEARLQPDALEKRLAWFKKALGQPQGLMLQGVARSDPVGLGDVAGMRLRALQAGIGDAGLVAGRITSADGRHVLISALPDFGPSELKRSKALLAGVLPAARRVESQFPAGTVRIAITGAHRVALDNATIIQADSMRTSVIATVAVAALMLAAYRRRWLSVLGLAPTLFGGLGAIVVFYLTGEPVSAVALGCGSILIGVTVDYGIYVLYHVDDAPPVNRAGLARAVAQLVPTLGFGALTTMAAFLVMVVSPVGGHRQLGMFGAVGVAVAAAVAMVILPVLIPVGNAASGRVLPLTAAMQRLFGWRDRYAGIVGLVLLGFSVWCGIGLGRLHFDGDLARFNGVTAETRADEAVVREVWGKALSLTTIVTSGAGREEALQNNEEICALLHDLQQKQVIEGFSSIAPLLPSDRSRRSNWRDWQAFWTEPRRRELGNVLAKAGTDLGFRTNAFASFLNRIAAPLDPQTASRREASALDRLLGDYCSEKGGRLSICTLVKVKDRQGYQVLREAVLRQTPGALLLNKAALGDEIARIAKHGLPIFAALVVALNAALLFLYLGRVELVLITLLPMAAGVFWTLGTLGLMGLPIDMSNFIFVIFVIGVGGDYSLFLLMAELEPLRGYPSRTASTGGAVTICALTTLFGVGVLALARHPALFSIGITALLGISFSLLATLLLVPLCTRGLKPRGTLHGSAKELGAFTDSSARRKLVRRLYRYQGLYVSQFVFWKMKTDPLFRAVEEAVPRQGRILDLGCGYGIVAHWLTLAAPGRTVLGVDSDEQKVRVACATARENSRVSFESRDILGWPEYPACDSVLLCDVLHYFPREFKAKVVRQAFQALSPGGCLVVRDAGRDETAGHRAVVRAERWAVRLGQNKTAHGLHFESVEEHLVLLRGAGFTRIETRKEAGLGSNVMLIAWKGPLEPETG